MTLTLIFETLSRSSCKVKVRVYGHRRNYVTEVIGVMSSGFFLVMCVIEMRVFLWLMSVTFDL